MGFSDRLRAWMKGESSRGKGSKRSTPSSDASRSATRDLEEFVRTRVGVEAFLEPKTAIYSTTVLLVADDGEYLRRPVKDREEAGAFARRINIPLYDARKVGYPKRMRDYDQGKRPRRVELSELPPWPGDERDQRGEDGPPPPPTARQAPVEPAADAHADGETTDREPDADPDQEADAGTDPDPRDDDPRDDDPQAPPAN